MTPEHSIPSLNIFGGEYNAKGVTSADIAETFVPPMPLFQHLVRGDHAILIGPRGSGKTTLLKMLQGASLEAWDAPEAEHIRQAVGYTGVFVPADRAWAEQLRAPTLDGTTVAQFATATFTLHCLRALVRTAERRCQAAAPGVTPHRRVTVEASELRGLARMLSTEWHVGRPVADLGDLRRALTAAISHLGAVRSVEAGRDEKRRASRLADEPLLHLSLIPAATLLVELFNDLVDEPDGRWAFLFDEIELVPRVIENQIMSLLRGTDERFLFKVSYAPYERQSTTVPAAESGLGQPLGPQAAQDFSILRLTFANKRAGFDFSEALLDRELSRRRIGTTPTDLLGETLVVGVDSEDLEDGDENGSGAAAAATVPGDRDDAQAYAAGTPRQEMLQALREIDPTFDDYLERHKLDITHAEELPEERRAILRKILPVVALRLAYGTRAGRLRTRQNVSLYSGTEAFYAMIEANPRWLKHVTDRLLEHRRKLAIPPEAQSRVLREAASEFTGYLRVLPMTGTQPAIDDAPKLLLNRIGDYFHSAYLRADFTADPPGSIRVDAEFSDTVMSSLQALINRGALVQVPDRQDPGLGSLLHKRFRPAYLLAPLYGLALRLDKAAPLSRVLQATPGGQLMIGEGQDS